MKKTTFLMTGMLAVAIVLAAGLTVLPSSVQEAQANPCSQNVEASSGNTDDGGLNSGTATGSIASTGDQTCNFVGPVEFDED